MARRIYSISAWLLLLTIIGAPGSITSARAQDCLAHFVNNFPDTDVNSMYVGGTHYSVLGYGGTLDVPLAGPTEVCIWECVWDDMAEEWDCRYDCAFTACPGGEYEIVQSGPWANQTMVTVAPGDCTPIYAAPAAPPSPYQSVTRVTSPEGDELVIELRNTNLPQGLFIRFGAIPPCACLGEAITQMNLVPRSGTGPVFRVSSSQVYFLIDNLTAPGYYDLELTCAGGSRTIIPANIHYVGYQGYTPSGTLVNDLTGNTIRGAGVSIWQDDGMGGFNLYDSMIASDGTYFFDVPSGLYRILVEYELGGEYWTDTFAVNSPIPEGIVPPLVPVTDDQDGPEFVLVPLDASRVTGSFHDGGVGLAAVEIVAGTLDNVTVTIDDYGFGDADAAFGAVLADPSTAGSVTLVGLDRLGNRTEQLIELVPVVSAVPGRDLPPRATLVPAYPNPFNPSTTIVFHLDKASPAMLRVYDISGRLVRTLMNERAIPAGRHEIHWDGRDEALRTLPSGAYFYRLDAGGSYLTGRAMLIK